MLCWVSCLLYIEKRCKKSPSKEILDHSILCFVMLCCPLGSGLFSFFYSKATGVRTRGSVRPFTWLSTTCRPQVDSPSGLMCSMNNIPQCLHSCDQFSANKQSAHCLYKYYTNMWCLPALPEEQGANRCTRRGDQVTAGHKNAYSSLWLVHKLTAGRLGLGLGAEPGPELAQLLAAMLSLPQPQPHCAKPLHTYNLLIIHEVFRGVKKYIANLESRSKTDTDWVAAQRKNEAKSIYITLEEERLMESQSISTADWTALTTGIIYFKKYFTVLLIVAVRLMFGKTH